MQRPRRTSEFHEEIVGTAKKRHHVRGQMRCSRPTSLERASFNPNSLGVGTSSGTVRGTTPQRSTTPLHNSRVLFTAEKQRPTGNMAAPLHNDKKWVKERCASIMEHLRAAFDAGALSGIVNLEFFNRPNGGLRQMSIKQFVGIINYFLQYVWGNRFTASCAGHVDDIVNFLQKLHYPYQMNKSWLKTPNAQHSFGNIIVLLDFLMDFVSSVEGEEQANDVLFPFQNPSELRNNTVSDGHLLEVPDSEFQALMIRHSEEGFILWDKQLMEDFTALQQRTCDALILKRCGLLGTASLDVEIEVLRKTLADLEKKRQSIPKNEEQLGQQLSEELKYALLGLQILHDDLEQNGPQLMLLQGKRDTSLREISRLEEEIAQTKSAVRNQICSRKQHEKLIEDIVQQKHMLLCKERTIMELQERSHQQQVLLSRTKKQFTDQVEKLNAHMREIIFSHMHSNLKLDTEDLQFPLNVEQKHLELMLPLLRTIQRTAEQMVRENIKRETQMQGEIASLACLIDLDLEPSSKSILTSVNMAQSIIQQFEQNSKVERDELDKKLKQLEELVTTQDTTKKQHEKILTEKQRQVQKLQLENKETMATAEQEYNICANAREAVLDQYAATLEHTNIYMQKLMGFIRETGCQLGALKDLPRITE